jgi:hypothetical protein
VGANIDTWLINVKGKLPDGLAEELDFLKEANQEADEDIPPGGPSLEIRSSSKRMAQDGNVAGYCTVPACISKDWCCAPSCLPRTSWIAMA